MTLNTRAAHKRQCQLGVSIVVKSSIDRRKKAAEASDIQLIGEFDSISESEHSSSGTPRDLRYSDSGEAGRGGRVLFDPVFSDRCSPTQFFGPKRYTEPPCKIEEIPEVDAVVISHNHYDHLDNHTISTLFKRTRVPHIFAPLGNEKHFESIGVPKGHAHTLDCTSPAGGCTIRVRLWSSWAVEGEGKKVYFAGDTGYRSVKDGEDEAERPVCPAFKEIGERFGGFDLAMIPIGAYEPRWFMSTIHCAPQDSVRIFKDIRAKKAVAMHWGTWILTTEEVTEPPKRLAEECKKIGIEEGDFLVSDIGETKCF
ncbi:beta-lactamase superfamily domain-containing protein [Armillaria fumosa]|nr:beta-lactamase superfamily domain-containing protein [Armillaria fumosa]